MNELEKKILWQCRRGLWELDAILIPFVEEKLDSLNEIEIEHFRELLSFEDIDMFDILVNKKAYQNEALEPIISKIINFHNSNLEI